MPITIFCSFTRRWAIDKWLEDLSNIDHNPAETNLCIIVDINEPYILNNIRKFAEPYRYFHYKMNENWHPNEVRLSIRRARVAEIKNQSKDLIARTDGEIIIGLEDDTDLERLKSFEELYQPLLDNKNTGFVEGVQMGRWGANIIGAWEADNINNPKEIKTLLPGSGLENITGGGFYGYATRRELYLNHDYYTSTSEPWGPDVNYGFYVNRQGYNCFINWDIIFGHREFNKTGWSDQNKLVQVVFNKNINNGKWDRFDTEQDRF